MLQAILSAQLASKGMSVFKKKYIYIYIHSKQYPFFFFLIPQAALVFGAHTCSLQSQRGLPEHCIQLYFSSCHSFYKTLCNTCHLCLVLGQCLAVSAQLVLVTKGHTYCVSLWIFSHLDFMASILSACNCQTTFKECILLHYIENIPNDVSVCTLLKFFTFNILQHYLE